MQKVTDALFSLKEATTPFAPQGFVTKCFLIFIIDEVKNFAANIFFKLVSASCTGIRAKELVTYWDLCIKGRRSYIEEFRGSEAVKGFCCKFIQGSVTKYFLIFIVDEVKNFAANSFFKLVCQSRIGSRASLVSHVLRSVHKDGVHILKNSKVLKRQKVSAVSSSTGIVESRDKGFVLNLKLLFTIVNFFSRRFPLGFLL